MTVRNSAKAVYAEIKELWRVALDQTPSGRLKPPAEEAVKVARKLYRAVRGRSWKGRVRVTSGNRYNGFRNDYGVTEMVVNPDKTWDDFIHEWSHRLYNGPGAHTYGHACLERRLVKIAIKRGWLDGALRPKPKPEPVPETGPLTKEQAKRAAATVAGIARWEAKRKRAERALAKLRRRAAYYDKLGGSSK